MNQPGGVRKYRNTPVVVDGIRFDSKGEARRWGDLNFLQRANHISDLKRQVTFDLGVCKFRADFTYVQNGALVVEDFKGVITPEFRIKAKLMKQVHGIEVVVTR